MKKKKNIVRYGSEEIKNAPSRSDWQRLRKMKDADIDTSDLPLLTPAFWRHAKWFKPAAKKPVTIRLDSDVIGWFKQQGAGYQSHINAVLKAYATVHNKL